METKNSWWRFDVSQHRMVLKDDQAIPDDYGVAYWDPMRAVAVCYPIPINLVVGFWYNTVLPFFKYGMAWRGIELGKAYERGRDEERKQWSIEQHI